MNESPFVKGLRGASSCIQKLAAESADLKENLAKANEKIAGMDKEAEALKLAMEMSLDAVQLSEVMDKFAVLKTKDLNVVKEAMNLDLVKQASLGDIYENSEPTVSGNDPMKAFMSILRGNK